MKKTIFTLFAVGILLLGCSNQKEVITKCMPTGDIRSEQTLTSKGNKVLKQEIFTTLTWKDENEKNFVTSTVDGSTQRYATIKGITYAVNEEAEKITDLVSIDYEQVDFKELYDKHILPFDRNMRSLPLDLLTKELETAGYLCSQE